MELIDNWYKTAREVLFHPKEFFSKMPTTGGLGEPFRFALINIFIAAVLSAGAMLAFPSADIKMILLTSDLAILGFMAGAVITTLIVGSIGIFIVAAIYHLFLKLTGAKKDFEATYRVLAYVSVFNILTAISSAEIPALQGIAFFISLYVIYLIIRGFSKVHEITMMRAGIAVLIPIIIAIVLVVAAMVLLLATIGAQNDIMFQTASDLERMNLPMQAKAISGMLK
ncbi:MAG: YIP1 family protein [archaeon]